MEAEVLEGTKSSLIRGYFWSEMHVSESVALYYSLVFSYWGLPRHRRCSLSAWSPCTVLWCSSGFPWRPRGRRCTWHPHQRRILGVRSPRQHHLCSAQSVLWSCSPLTAWEETRGQSESLTFVTGKLAVWGCNTWGYIFRAYQHLNVLVVLGDALDVSWALPWGEAYSIQGAPAKEQTWGISRADNCGHVSGGGFLPHNISGVLLRANLMGFCRVTRISRRISNLFF